jgi:anti-sigma B factor antagonist
MSSPLRRRIEVEDVGDIIIVNFLDRRIVDVQNIQEIGEQLFALVDKEKRRKVMLSFSNVEFLSSAALGKLIALHKKLQSLRGKLVLCATDSEMFEAFEESRLNKFFNIYAEESQALEDLSAGSGNDILIGCPVSGCPGRSRVNAARVGDEVRLRCRECGVRIQLVLPDVLEGGEARSAVTGAWLPTHEKQEVRLVPGPPLTLQVASRLDLFASEAMARLWQAIPPPRHAVIDCRQTTELSEEGAAALARLLTAGGGKAVLLVSRYSSPAGAAFPAGAPLYTAEQEAQGAVNDEGRTPITVKVCRSCEGGR